MQTTTISLYRPSEHETHIGIADASCFYFPSVRLRDSATPSEALEGLAAVPGRIEVSDKEGAMHYHCGVTIVYIACGYGSIRTEDGSHEVRAGDTLIVPAYVKHLSVAAPGTTMIEQIVFIGKEGDLQAVYE